MIRLLAAVLLLLLACPGVSRAQNVNVLLNSGQTAVLGVCPPGNCAGVVSIPSSDARWTAWKAQLTAQNNVDSYLGQLATHVASGIVITSSGNSSLNGTYPLDNSTQTNLQGIYSGIAGSAMFTGSISGTALSTSSVVSGAVAVGQYVTGTGVAPGTQITGGSGSSWTVSISQNVGAEPMTAGGLGTGLPGGQSVVPLVDSTGATHNFDAPHFMYYRNAVIGLLLTYSYQYVQVNGWPSSNAVTIP